MTSAKAYTYYGDDNGIHVGADITGVKENSVEEIKACAAEKLEKGWAPEKIVCM